MSERQYSQIYSLILEKLSDMSDGKLDDLVADVAASYPLDAAEAQEARLDIHRYPEMRRMFYRLGLTKSMVEGRTNEKRIAEIVEAIRRRSGRPYLQIDTAILLYCSSQTSRLTRPICGDVPLCDQCVLTDFCKYYKKRPTIKDLPEDERPRERLIRGGEEMLSDAELLGIIIRDGTPKESAVDLARRLLARHGDFRSLSAKTIGELCEISGIGEAKAAQIKAALEIAKRFSGVTMDLGVQFKCSYDIYNHFRPMLMDKKKETFLTVLLDSKHKLIRELEVSKGSLTSSIVHPREVFTFAIRESAAAVIFVHNHPSGDPAPSREDMDITRRLKDAGEIIGIDVLDHIIIGEGSYTSFADKGIL